MTVWVGRAIWNTLMAEADDKAPLETGGLLLGYFGSVPTESVVADIIGPGPKAVHRKESFVPDAEHQERELARRYEDSGRLLAYVGDWHTHPTGSGGLSPTDARTLRKIARSRSARIPVPLMLVAHDEHDWQLAAWQFLGGIRGRASKTQVRIIDS